MQPITSAQPDSFYSLMNLAAVVPQLEDRKRLRLLLRSFCAGDTPSSQVYRAIRSMYPTLSEAFVLDRMAWLRLVGSEQIEP